MTRVKNVLRKGRRGGGGDGRCRCAGAGRQRGGLGGFGRGGRLERRLPRHGVLPLQQHRLGGAQLRGRHERRRALLRLDGLDAGREHQQLLRSPQPHPGGRGHDAAGHVPVRQQPGPHPGVRPGRERREGALLGLVAADPPYRAAAALAASRIAWAPRSTSSAARARPRDSGEAAGSVRVAVSWVLPSRELTWARSVRLPSGRSSA